MLTALPGGLSTSIGFAEAGAVRGGAMTARHGQLTMTKDQMREGFARGRTLTQEEWAHPQEITWVDELIAEGKATATEWRYHDNFQCEMRKITGIPAVANQPERG